MDGETQIGAGRKLHRAASRRVRGIDGSVDRNGIERLAVARSAVRFHVEGRGLQWLRRKSVGQDKAKAEY